MIVCRANHRVITGSRQWMAAQHARQRHPAAAQHAEPLYRFHRVFRTSRQVAAGYRQHGRDRPLISPQQLQRCNSRVPHHTPSFRDCFRETFCSITSKARLTSFNTFSKSAVSSDFFGLITTSTATGAPGRVNRTASRSRRFMRFRSTAPPSTRPTVNPTRSPCGAGAPARFCRTDAPSPSRRAK